MKNTALFLLTLCAILTGISKSYAQQADPNGLSFEFVENSISFTKADKALIEQTVTESEKSIRTLLPELPENIKVILEIMPRNIDQVGGTTGRAQKFDPYGEVFVYISSEYPGGVEAAVNASLTYTIHHEFHHLARGWTMEGNKFERGIDIAMVNEGMAVVFGEIYSQEILEGNSIPDEAEAWIAEVLELPKDANYNTWMNEHPDGRQGIGYRSGNYLIRKAMEKSGKNILEMSELQPEEVLVLAGY